MRMLDIILKKRRGQELSREELEFVSSGAASGSVPDYQLAAWLMSAYFNPLSNRETADFTRAMATSGRRMEYGALGMPKVDKHSTGGVGDGISLALAPLVACAGVAVPMMSGRGLGHTGGTLDKLESMRDFKVGLPPEHIKKQMKAIGVCMFGQTKDLAPADRKLYALRDATGTVESRPLIVASILSKKYAEGVDALVMDVKYGDGAFLIDYKESKLLAQALVKTAKLLGINCVGLLTDMNQPLGRAVGNAMEMEQTVNVLKGDDSVPDFTRLTLELGAWMVFMSRKASSVEKARKILEGHLRSGAALEKLRQMVKWQGGDPRLVDDPGKFLPKAKLVCEFKAPRGGYVKALRARAIGYACVVLGGGRSRMEDTIDFGAGIMLEKKVGDAVRQGEVLARLYASDPKRLAEGKAKFAEAVEISAKRAAAPVLIKEVVK